MDGTALGSLTRLTRTVKCVRSGVDIASSACAAFQRACLPDCVLRAETAAFTFAAESLSNSTAGRLFRKVEATAMWGLAAVEAAKDALHSRAPETTLTEHLKEMTASNKALETEKAAVGLPVNASNKFNASLPGAGETTTVRAVKRFAEIVEETTASGMASMRNLIGCTKASAFRTGSAAADSIMAPAFRYATSGMQWVSAQFWALGGAKTSDKSYLDAPTVAEKASNFALACIVWLSLVVAFALSASVLVFV